MKFIVLTVSSLLLAGCSLIPMQPYIQTYYYDIGTPKEHVLKKSWNLEIMSFDTSGPYQQRMVFRTGPNSIKFDEFNRWSMVPASMFKRYLLMVYDCGDDNQPNVLKKYSLNAEIVQLEADLPNKMVNLAVRFSFYETVKGNTIWTRTFKQQIPVEKITGDSYAAGVKQAMDNIIQDLDTHLQEAK